MVAIEDLDNPHQRPALLLLRWSDARRAGPHPGRAANAGGRPAATGQVNPPERCIGARELAAGVVQRFWRDNFQLWQIVR